MNMAKPIRVTPTLRGEEAKNFLKKMIKEEKYPNKKRVELIKKANSMKFDITY